ncbi:MAG: glycosyltransferase family 2 protein [Psychrobium sp.]
MYKGQSVVAIIPALNEELAIKKVVSQLLALRANEQQVIDEVIVCDNGSTDSTAQVAADAGAVVVRQDIPGYGIACLTAMERLPNCDIVLFVDGDDSCFAQQALPMLEGIVNGDDLAIGSRNLGHIEKGALTSTQMFGNWLSSHLITLFWGQKITDLGPFRAMRRDSLMAIDMQDKTFGWTVEMQVKAIICGMQVSEYSVDSKVRIGESKISGTLSGSVKAGIGILSMIAKLYLKKRRIVKHYLRYGQ